MIVSPDALAEWSADAQRAARRMTTSMATLHPVIGQLGGTWQGEAAEAFGRHYTRWQDATARLLTTLGDLVRLVETAHANYSAAITANTRIWGGATVSVSGPAVVHPMGARKGKNRIDADIDDVRVTVDALVRVTDELAAAWTRLGGALAGTGAMAGDDEAGTGFGGEHDAMASAAWQGWRSAAILLASTAGGLAETGNNIIDAERDSRAGGPFDVPMITQEAAPVPDPPRPPSAIGDNGSRSLVAPLAPTWPTADPRLLRDAASAWRGSTAALRDVGGRTAAAVDALVDANPDPVLELMRTFTRRAFSQDPTHGLLGRLGVTGGRIADACDLLADATVRTRGLMRDAVLTYVDSDEWYHPVAAVLDAVLTRGAAKVVALGGDLLLLEQRLSQIQFEHDRAVALIRHNLSPIAVEHLARLATAIAPPTPAAADTCAVVTPAGAVGAPAVEAQRQALIGELVATSERRVDPAEIMHIARAPDGRIVWLGRGDGSAGLSHILRAGRLRDFMKIGVAPTDIPGVALRALTEGTPVGRVRGGAVVYDVDVGGGRRERIVVVVSSSNGFIVTAYPPGRRTRIDPL